ncbi:MAG: hypothetical protein OXC55_09030 [Chloroflexi bacterium]|nr:hypothetical protein [Chloroflexota bacterium]
MTTAERLYRNAAGLSEVGELLQTGDAVLAGEIPMAALTEADRLRLLAYPGSLARRIRRGSQSASLRVVYVVPDLATDEATHAPGRPFNLTPSGKTYGRQPDPEACDESRARHWEALFDAHTQELKDSARASDIEIVRTSELADKSGFLSVLRLALRSPAQIADAIRESGVTDEVDDEPLTFAGAACRECGSINGQTDYDPDWDRAQFNCGACGYTQEADIREQSMWMQEDVLRAAVIAALNPAVAIRRPGAKWDARENFVDSILMLAGGDGASLPTRLAPPSLDSEQGGTPLKDLIRLADDWDEDYAELP